MSLQKLFQHKKLQSLFEQKAISAGYVNFNRRAGGWYCDSNLNLLAEGFLMAREDVLTFTDMPSETLMIAGAPTAELIKAFSEPVRHAVNVELSPGFQRGMDAVTPISIAPLSFEARNVLCEMIHRLSDYEVSPAYEDAEYIQMCGELIDEIQTRQQKLMRVLAKQEAQSA